MDRADHLDQPTLAAYAREAATLAASYRTIAPPLAAQITRWFPAEGRILDIGSGSGRDLVWLREQGYDAVGLEPCDEMREAALQAYPALTGYLRAGSLPLPSPDQDAPYDAILCSAVLMHLPQELWFDAIYSMRESLRDGGVLLVTLSTGRSGLDGAHRDPSGRFYHEAAPETVQLLFERAGFRTEAVSSAGDSLGRGEITWHSFVFRRVGAEDRPLDTIQSIIGREQKVATYKLALLRAFAEIALKDYQLVKPAGNGRIAIPVELLAERWLGYYWPLLGGDTFLPQLNGEKEEGGGPRISFRRELHALASALQGGYRALANAQSAGTLAPDLRRLHRKALSKIKRAIITGPVTHAAPGFFVYDTQTKSVTMPLTLWLEFTHLSPWIESAALLEWAQVTRSISRGGVTVAEVLGLLVEDYEPGRDVYDARSAYAGMPGLRCVWSEQRLHSSPFDVDHAIPFSLWRNNDLWNLLPANPQVNNRKRDRLPTVSLIERASERIVASWRHLAGLHERRFERELQAFVGGPLPRGGWENTALARLKEAVEVSAIQFHVATKARYDGP